MNRHSSSPQIQNASGPDNVISVRPTTIISVSAVTITGLAPNRSSSRPPATAPTAATRHAHTPNSSTLAGEMPYTLTPSTAPKVKTPVSPSRKIALATR